MGPAPSEEIIPHTIMLPLQISQFSKRIEDPNKLNLDSSLKCKYKYRASRKSTIPTVGLVSTGLFGLRRPFPKQYMLGRVEFMAWHLRRPKRGIPTWPSNFWSSRAWVSIRAYPHNKMTLSRIRLPKFYLVLHTGSDLVSWKYVYWSRHICCLWKLSAQTFTSEKLRKDSLLMLDCSMVKGFDIEN